MQNLKALGHMDIDWNLSPEHAVTMYLEWGNNNWHAEHPPVRSRDDYSVYFVVDTWGPRPMVRLVRRNSESAEDIYSAPLPEPLANGFVSEFGKLRGIYEPTPEIKQWLRQEMGLE